MSPTKTPSEGVQAPQDKVSLALVAFLTRAFTFSNRHLSIQVSKLVQNQPEPYKSPQNMKEAQDELPPRLET